MPPELLETCALLFAFTLAGGLLPLVGRWSERGLHLFVSISAGIFLGLVFLHLLPEMAGGSTHAGHAHGHAELGAADSKLPWIATLGGFLLLFFVEKIWLEGRAREDQHRALGAASYVGLVLHTLVTGLGLAAVFEDQAFWLVALGATIAHKASEAFSLASLMRLAGLSLRASVGWLALYSAVAPLGLAIGLSYDLAQSEANGLITGLACGTFLYVAVCDLLPEVFHGAKQRILPTLGVLGGVLAAGLGEGPFGEVAKHVVEIVRAAWNLLVDFAPLLLLGFALSGLLAEWLKPEKLLRYLRGENLRSVAAAAALGAPLPLCSCSVLPLAFTLRKSGASKGATVSFLVSTPETGVDSVLVSWALLDPVLAVLRPVGAVFSALVAGAAVSFDARRAGAAASADPGAPAAFAPQSAVSPGAAPAAPCCAQAAHELPSAAQAPAAGSGKRSGVLLRALRYGFVDLLDDIAPYLALGLLLSGLVSVLVPPGLFDLPVLQGFSGLLVMLVVGVPLYVCASASTPIAAALLAKGLSPGAALVFLLAGPATNVAALVPLSRLLGRRALTVYLASLAAATLALGAFTNAFAPAWMGAAGSAPGAAPADLPAEHAAHGASGFELACAGALAALLAAALVRRYGRPLDSLRAPAAPLFTPLAPDAAQQLAAHGALRPDPRRGSDHEHCDHRH